MNKSVESFRRLGRTIVDTTRTSLGKQGTLDQLEKYITSGDTSFLKGKTSEELPEHIGERQFKIPQDGTEHVIVTFTSFQKDRNPLNAIAHIEADVQHVPDSQTLPDGTRLTRGVGHLSWTFTNALSPKGNIVDFLNDLPRLTARPGSYQ